jgi:general secretion pathway protein G
MSFSEERCEGCGSKLTPGARYCLACYRPIGTTRETNVHGQSAVQIPTTRRPDPAIVFLPEVREAMDRRKGRIKRAMIAVVAVIVFLALGATLWTRHVRQQAQAKKAMVREEMAVHELTMLKDSLEYFRADIGRYPTTQEGLACLTRRPVSPNPAINQELSNWSGPYLDGIFEVDPWGNDYVYQAPDGGRSFVLFSYGPEGEASGRISLRVQSDAN